MFQFSFLVFMVGLSLILLSHGGNEYQIFYKYPGFEQMFPLELDSDGTVADVIQKISRERAITKEYEMKMSLKGDVLLEGQSLSEAGIGADTAVDIILIQLTPYQQILNAFANTNFKAMPNDTVDLIIISIFNKLEIEGTIDFSLLPDTIQNIVIANTNLSGTVDLMNLPQNLIYFQLTESNFTVDLSQMHRDRWPQHLEVIDLGKNEFISGRLDCSQLPRSLSRLDVSYAKQLDIVFNDLPSQLKYISLSFSVLNGLNLSNPLPDSLKGIAIQDTKISGEIKLNGLRNCASFEFLTYDEEMRERIEKVAHESEVNVDFYPTLVD